MLKYYKLFDLLNRRGIKKTDLLTIISSPTLAKIGKGKNIQTDAIDKICIFLECQPGDIMECIIKEFPINKNEKALEKRALRDDIQSEKEYDIREIRKDDNEILEDVTFDDILEDDNNQ